MRISGITYESLCKACKKGNIKWTLHALNRIRERKIPATSVVGTILNGEVLTHYHDDKPFPSWLIFNFDEKHPLHVVASTDDEKAYIITAYEPTLDEWEHDFKTRKEQI
ncbi:MAG: DUF4258 domain-containing protein [Defluviitaleaceae bacterium]|nr:DUF4258 domain-containing protein [Defluviitaleaceae bacterium]